CLRSWPASSRSTKKGRPRRLLSQTARTPVLWCAVRLLDGAAQPAEQAAHGGSKNDQTSNSQNGDKSDDKAILDQALRPVPRLLHQHEKRLLRSSQKVGPTFPCESVGLYRGSARFSRPLPPEWGMWRVRNP